MQHRVPKSRECKKRGEREERLKSRIVTPGRFWLNINLSTVEARQGQLLGKENLMGSLNQKFLRTQMGLGIIWVPTIQSGENLIE